MKDKFDNVNPDDLAHPKAKISHEINNVLMG